MCNFGEVGGGVGLCWKQSTDQETTGAEMAESDLSSASGGVELENLEIWWKLCIGADYKRIINIFWEKT